jgi:hypothetical protein
MGNEVMAMRWTARRKAEVLDASRAGRRGKAAVRDADHV